MLKFLRQSNEEFEKRRRQRKNIRETEKPKEVKVNKNVDKHFNNKESIIKENIWKEIKFFTGFVLLLITFVGIIYFLKNISSGKKVKIKKEKNKKEKIN